MQSYQREFIEFSLQNRVLRFGSFTLKSGRESPYFFNSGLFHGGASLARLGRCYADAIIASHISFDMLYGAAYKGIPLVAATAIALAEHYDRDLPWCFNRKEAKDHGELGRCVGASLEGRVLMIDDVISAGTSVRESVAVIGQADATPVGIAIALDRQERGVGPDTALAEVAKHYGLQTISIVSLADLIAFLNQEPGMHNELLRMQDYLSRYGGLSQAESAAS